MKKFDLKKVKINFMAVWPFFVLSLVIFCNLVFMGFVNIKSASAANLSEVSQYRYSNYGSFQNAGWLDYTHFTQASNGEIYYSLDKRKKETDPLFRICHFVATQQDECKDISSEVTSLVTPRPAFNNIAADTNNNIYVSYVNFATLTIVVFKIAVSTLTVVKSWVYNTPGQSSVPTIFPQKSFVQNNVLYFSFMYDTVPLINSASYLYIDLNNPNSQIETIPYANCVPGEETCNLKFIDFSVVESNAQQAITVLLYSEGQGENKKAQISIISNKKIISSYIVSDISGVDDRLVNAFFINENTLVMVNSYNYIHYFNISKNKVITLVKEFKSPLTKIVTADSDNSENIYLDGVLMDSGQEFIYKLSQDGKFTKMQVDPKYYQFKLKKFPDGCVYATAASLDGQNILPTDLLRACNSDSFDYLDTFGLAQRLQTAIYFVNHKELAAEQKANSSMSDVLIFSYNPFDPSLTDNLNNWVRLVYNQVPSPSPSPTPNPNPLPYPDTGINLLSLSLLFLFLSGVGISLYFYRKNRYVQTTHI